MQKPFGTKKKRQGLPAKIRQKSAKIRQKPANSRKSRKDVVCLFQKPAYAVCSLAKFMPKIVLLAIWQKKDLIDVQNVA